MEKNEFEFYDYLKEIIDEIIYDTDEKYNENIILKKIIYTISCELCSCFLDNVFLMSKLKFQGFDDNKKFTKVMLDILYQIGKQFNTFPFKCIITLFETLSLGNYEKESMIFFIKALLSFYFTHQLTMLSIQQGSGQDYEKKFKKKYKGGYEKMKSLLQIIPIIELGNDKDDENLFIIFRIYNDDTKPSTLPPVKQKGMGLSQDNFFSTAVKNA